jgi:hypothetical protein
MEYDGPAWREILEDQKRRIREEPNMPPGIFAANYIQSASHLIPIDASNEAAPLRARHPDPSSIVILPAVIEIRLEPSLPEAGGRPSRPARISGVIQDVPTSIHVPLPFSEAFRRLPKDRDGVKYKVHFRYGRSLEPWIVGVEFPPH